MAVRLGDRQQQPPVFWLLKGYERSWTRRMTLFTIRLLYDARRGVIPSMFLPQRRFGLTASLMEKGGSNAPPHRDGRGLGAATQR
ncbi:MAG: hypothetical protein OWR62_02355 [Sulfobacillus thermotolerans]|nr:hypothetical protein [Sulfobacillus thermotolerans]